MLEASASAEAANYCPAFSAHCDDLISHHNSTNYEPSLVLTDSTDCGI